MKKLWIYILLLFSLVEIWSCSGQQNYDNRLTAADSLIKLDVDSALTLLEAINPASLGSEADQAYHALLLTEARYKCYIPATSDSAVNLALDYYEQHGREQENSPGPTSIRGPSWKSWARAARRCSTIKKPCRKPLPTIISTRGTSG